MTDMRQLYQEVILDHNRKPRNFGSILGANRHAEGHNPLCGDHIRLSMNVLENKIEETLSNISIASLIPKNISR